MNDDNRPFNVSERAAEMARALEVTSLARVEVIKALITMGEEAWRAAMHQAAVSVDVAREEGFRQGEAAAQEGFKALLKRQKNDAVQKVIRARRKAKRLRREAKFAELSAVRSRGFANACEHVIYQLDPGGEDDE